MRRAKIAVPVHDDHDVAACLPERDIATGALEQQDIAFRGRGAVDHCGQVGDVEHHGIERILGSCLGRGEDDGDRLADIADLLVRNDRLLECAELGRCFLPQRTW